MGFGWSGRGKGGTEPVDLGMIAEVRAYWEALREGQMLPRRDRIDPRGIAGALEHSFLIERIGAGIARFRIAGLAYNDLMGMDIRGMPVSCLFLGDAREKLQTDLERVFKAPSILTLDLVAERSIGRPHLRGRMQILPMLGQREDSDLAIGCIELDGEIGRSPRRFSIATSKWERLATETARATPQRLPEPTLAHARPPKARPGVPYLRLVKA